MWTIIKKGIVLPDDFLDIEGYWVNRDKYVVEGGYSDKDYWQDEYLTPVSLEMVGAILIGSNMYCDIRYRERTELDKPFDKYNTLIARIMQTTLID